MKNPILTFIIAFLATHELFAQNLGITESFALAQWADDIKTILDIIVGTFAIVGGFYVFLQYIQGNDQAQKSFFRFVVGLVVFGIVDLLMVLVNFNNPGPVATIPPGAANVFEGNGTDTFAIAFGNIAVPARNAAETIVLRLQLFCGIFAISIIFIFVGSKVIINFLKPEEPLNPYTLVRPILILMAIALYGPLHDLLLVTPESLIWSFTRSATNWAIQQGPFPDPNWRRISAGFMDHLDPLSPNPSVSLLFDFLSFNTFFEIFHLVLYLLSHVVILYILFKQILAKTAYHILGVFVLPFSLIVGNEKALNTWFFGYLGIILWVPILEIFLFIMKSIQSDPTVAFLLDINPASPTAYDWGDPMSFIYPVMFQLLAIFQMLAVPRYASLLVGGEGGEFGAGSSRFNSARKLISKPLSMLSEATRR